MLSHNDTIDPIWRAIAGHEVSSANLDPERLRHLADLISAAGVAGLLPDTEDVLGSVAVRQARLLNRFRRLQGEKWALALDGAGIPAVAIKGLASAHRLWPDPDARAVSDADLLVAPDRLGDALEFFRGEGFAFADMPTRGPWGFVGDASFQPLIAPGDGANIDLHIQGDAWPFEKALSARELLDAAVSCGPEGMLAPSPTHMMLIAASHAAGDLFRADAIKSVVDGLLLMRSPDGIDFGELYRRCRTGHLLGPVTVWLALLGRLGAVTAPAEMAGFRIGSVRGGQFESTVEAHQRIFAGIEPDGLIGRLRQEAILCAEPRVVLWRNWRRLSGLFRPRRGLPD